MHLWISAMPPYSQALWDRAKREARSLMIEAARTAPGTITYGELSAKMTSISIEPYDPIFHELLGEIAVEENAAGQALASFGWRKNLDETPQTMKCFG